MSKDMETKIEALAPQMAAEARAHMEHFKNQFADLAKHTMSGLIAEYVPFIETDAWANYRNYLQEIVESEYMSRASEARTSDHIWAKKIRDSIYQENKEELTQGLIKDLEEKIKELKELQGARRFY